MAASGPQSLDSGKIGVLVVEDEPLVLMQTAEVFRAAGMNVSEARDADTALAILYERSDIRVLITDFAMPAARMDGHDLVHIAARQWPDIGILVLSGADRPKPGNLPAGVRFMSKPCRDQDLVSAAFAFVSRQTGSI